MPAAFAASATTIVSGANTVTVTSGQSTLLSAVIVPFSGIASLSGSVVFILDAYSGLPTQTSGRPLWGWNAGVHSGPATAIPSLQGVELLAYSGIVATGVANSWLVVSWTQ